MLATPPNQRRNYYLIVSSVIGIQVTSSTIYMVFPLFFISAGLSAAESGILISIGTLAGIISGVTAGILSNRYGRRKILLFGTILYTLVFFLFVYLSHDFWTLISLRFIEGFGFYIMPVMVTTMAADIFPINERGKAMSLYSVSGGIGSLIGPLIAPFLIFGNNYNWYFLFSGGFVAVSALIMILFVHETLSPELKQKLAAKPAERRDISTSIKSLKRLGMLVGIFLAAVLLYRIGYTMIDPFFSLFLRTVNHIDLSLTSYIYAARALAIIAFSPLAGILVDRSGRKVGMLLGLGMTTMTMFGYIVLSGFLSMLLLRVWDGVTLAVILTSMNTLMADMLSSEMRGFGMGLQSAITQQSSTLGAFFSGFLIDAYGYTIIFYLAAAMCLISLIIVQVRIPEPHKKTV
jgi:DHA1 family solute carrier family 18 vesicular amine transporter 1/2